MIYIYRADCYPPDVSDPSRVIVTPDQPHYSMWSMIDLSCVNGTTSGGGTSYSYCADNDEWQPDPSGFMCYGTLENCLEG